jgi:hypothetical protein
LIIFGQPAGSGFPGEPFFHFNVDIPGGGGCTRHPAEWLKPRVLGQPAAITAFWGSLKLGRLKLLKAWSQQLFTRVAGMHAHPALPAIRLAGHGVH